MGVKLHLLDFGCNMADNSIFIAGENPGKRVKIPIMGCYIDHPKARILVDTGVSDPRQTAAVECQYAGSAETNAVSQLKKLGVDAASIDYVIVTHLHWDHGGGIRLFPNAKVLVRRQELMEAYVPVVKGDMNYHRVDFDHESIKWELLQNGVDYELLEGVTLLSVTGHTAGTQNVLVRTSEGPVIYASDSVYWYRNWNENRIPGICYSVPEWMNAVAKMKAINGVTVIPGHEPSIDMKRVYGR
jgi:glyoxylase-like metal-dependent hydrolase (beta-lactamase superfamily II)